MTDSGKSAPEIRFKGFTNAWEQRTFSDVLDYSIPNNTFSRSELNYEGGEVKNIHYGDILVKFDSCVDVECENIPFITNGYAIDYRNRLLQDGDIVFADTAEDETTGKAIEIINVQDSNIVAGLHTIAYRPRIKMSPYFSGYYFNSQSYRKQLLPLMQGIKVLSLSKTNLSKTETITPISLSEQTAIGSFFRTLDDTITLHKRKLDGLRELKKGYLQQMFPQAWECVPRVRFAGFTENWELKKLGEVVKVNSGKDYKHLNVGNIPVYGTGGYMLSVDESLSEVDAIGIGRKGTIDKPQFLTAPFWTVDTLFFMTPLQDNFLSFLYTLSQNIEWSKMDESTGVPSLSKVNIENIDTHVPNKIEQAAIGSFFRNLDEQISTQNNRVRLLQQLKNAYLEKMFI